VLTKVCEAGATQCPRRDAAAVKEMTRIGGRGRRPPGLGSLCDDHVRVGGPLGLAVIEAALQDLPARRVERHGLGTAAEPDRFRGLVDVIGAQVSDLTARSAVRCSSARMPSKASCGWASRPVVQRRNSSRCLSRGRACPVNPRGSRAARPRVARACKKRRLGRTHELENQGVSPDALDWPRGDQEESPGKSFLLIGLLRACRSDRDVAHDVVLDSV
jgi:hypothetical protein